MSEKPFFVGAASALITPFTKDGVDSTAMDKLIEWQIEEGIDALVIAGKGHENYQEIKGVKYPFSDIEEIKAFIKGEA
mgnify:CR=1 FL=1